MGTQVWALVQSDLCLVTSILWGGRGQRHRGGMGCGCICNVFFLIFWMNLKEIVQEKKVNSNRLYTRLLHNLLDMTNLQKWRTG